MQCIDIIHTTTITGTFFIVLNKEVDMYKEDFSNTISFFLSFFKTSKQI